MRCFHWLKLLAIGGAAGGSQVKPQAPAGAMPFLAQPPTQVVATYGSVFWPVVSQPLRAGLTHLDEAVPRGGGTSGISQKTCLMGQVVRLQAAPC